MIQGSSFCGKVAAFLLKIQQEQRKTWQIFTAFLRQIMAGLPHPGCGNLPHPGCGNPIAQVIDFKGF
ncbi:hypothetical protein IDZ75_31620 [Pseudomonas aeruginosa]|uniref:hypothetical protein n=1 Tax=Pseudomonas aeruginosa TaxID=287 RepID=UPI001ADD0E08|nr:hypothetical protein [Pseudomonas aeruginosa]MBO8356807.1 hypothetical protein [Pseudomonas aeruginosa]